MNKSINASGAVLKGLLWHYKGRCYPNLSPLLSVREANLRLKAKNEGDSGINSQESLEMKV